MRNVVRLLPLLLALAVLPCCERPAPRGPVGPGSVEPRGRIPASLDEVYARPRDFDLVNSLFLLILDQVGPRFKDLPKMNEQEKVVVLVWHWGEVINKGGFQYFFEQSAAAAAVAKAFDTLGVKAASEPLREVLALFPNARPAADTEARLKQFWEVQQAHKERIEGLEKQFWAADREVVRQLADYARRNRKAFDHLAPKANLKGREHDAP